MQVARLYGVGDLRLTDEAVPHVPPSMTLLRVTAVGLCGSDLHWYSEAGIGDARLQRPLILGHEFAAVIQGGPRHGERVAVDPAIPCERCATCREGHPNLCPDVEFAGHGNHDGALRERLAWPTHRLHPLPAAFSDADGALLEPLGVALHALDLAHVPLGSTVAVVGCGPIGLCVLQCARAAGAATVVAAEPLSHRREAARRLGADYAADPRELAHSAALADLLGGRGADVVFEVAGTDDAVDLALRMARPGARVVLAGIPDSDRTTFRASLARRKGLTVMLVRRMKDVYPRAIRLVQRGTVDLSSLVTHRYPLGEAHEAFQTASTRQGIKVIVEPSACPPDGSEPGGPAG